MKPGSRSKQFDGVVPYDRGRYFTLDERPVDDRADGRVVLRDVGAAGSGSAGTEPAHGQGPLRHRVNAVVRSQQRRLQQHTALQRFGVAHGGNLHIKPRARFDESRDVGCNQHHAHILGRKGGRQDANPVPLEHVRDGLFGVHRVFVAVARQSHHQAVTDELVVPRPRHDDEVTHANPTRGED